MIASTKHAFGLQIDNGLAILVHIGLNTVNLNEEEFISLKAQRDRVKKVM